MKKYILKYAAVSLIMITATNSAIAQYTTDTITFSPDHSPMNMVAVQSYDIPQYYRWDTPAFENVELEQLEQLEQYKNDNIKYLSDIEMMEKALKRNQKELNSLYKQARDHSKVLKNEQKNLKKKQKFYKQDEKLSKEEKKLRDKELKLLQKERKAYIKRSKNMPGWQIENKLQQFDERERRLKIDENNWKAKKEVNMRSIMKLDDTENTLDKRMLEINERLRELDRYKSGFDLKAKQLSLKKKQAKLSIKLAKAHKAS